MRGMYEGNQYIFGFWSYDLFLSFSVHDPESDHDDKHTDNTDRSA